MRDLLLSDAHVSGLSSRGTSQGPQIWGSISGRGAHDGFDYRSDVLEWLRSCASESLKGDAGETLEQCSQINMPWRWGGSDELLRSLFFTGKLSDDLSDVAKVQDGYLFPFVEGKTKSFEVHFQRGRSHDEWFQRAADLTLDGRAMFSVQLKLADVSFDWLIKSKADAAQQFLSAYPLFFSIDHFSIHRPVVRANSAL
jgi:hypothetical protein